MPSALLRCRSAGRKRWKTRGGKFDLKNLQCQLEKSALIWKGAYLSEFLFQHQQQVAAAMDRAKQVTMTELNTIIGVSLILDPGKGNRVATMQSVITALRLYINNKPLDLLKINHC